MYLSSVFIFSGMALSALLVAKRYEEQSGKNIFLLGLVSKGDSLVRHLSHELAHRYSELKEKAEIFVTKQIPMRVKGSANKGRAILKEKLEKFANDIRASHLLKKSDGLSEFFKNMSDIEKGNGEINDTFEYKEKGGQNDENEVDYRN